MIPKAKIKKALVVLSPDLIQPDKPKQSSLINRAVSLAKVTGCELELFHICYDSGLEHQLFGSALDSDQQRRELVDRDATMLAEMATRLKSEGINVRHEVRWDSPRTDAILRKIARARPDIVMKQGREHSFVLGMTSNTDWDLARRSPVHAWLVDDSVEEIDRVIAAIGNKFGDPGDITTATDYELLRTAGLIGDAFNAEIYPVNAYQVPEPQFLVSGAVGEVAPVVSADERKKLRTQRVKQHSGAVRAIAQYFAIKKNNVHICEGHPNDVIPEVADTIDADMIVMGAQNIGRLERLVSGVTVEPVIANSNTDVLIVKERDHVDVPKAAKPQFYGVPKVDLERAITDPESTFDSPQEVANLPELSIELRNRILQAWEHDLRAEMDEENEGGPVGDFDLKALDAVFSARALLEMKQKQASNDHMALHGMSG